MFKRLFTLKVEREVEEEKTSKSEVHNLVERLNLEEVLPMKKSSEEQLESFVEYIDYLINNDFNKLVNILYRVDVSEYKLRETLALNTKKSAGDLIARLILEREAEKIAWRIKYSQK